MTLIRDLGSWRQNAKTRFSQKLSNLEVWCILRIYMKLCNWAFRRTHYWIPKIHGWDPPSWKSTWRHFFCRGWSDLNKISETGAEWHVDCGDVVEIETRCRIPIWRTFGRIQWHVNPEPHATLQGVRIPSAILKIVFRHILFCFVFNAVWALTSGGFRIVSDTLVWTCSLRGVVAGCIQGTMEMLVAGAICGLLYALFSGQPLTIVGATGPMLVFESIVFRICKYDRSLIYTVN